MSLFESLQEDNPEASQFAAYRNDNNSGLVRNT